MTGNWQPHNSFALQASSSVTISVRNLSKRFNREWIFKSFTEQFLPGQTYAITGPNGSGKSTLLQVLWGQLPASEGELEYSNNAGTLPIEEIFRHVAIAAPYMDLIDEFTLQEHLEFHFKVKHTRNTMSVAEIMDRMKLGHARHKYISNFSSGMRQRLRLALAFYTQASLVFLDEPGTNLDKQAFDWYQTELHSIPTGTTIFIASNQPAEYPDSARLIDILKFK